MSTDSDPADTSTTVATGLRAWVAALFLGAGAGLLLAILSAGRPPVPVPGVAAPGYWLGWSPLAALAILGWLAIAERGHRGRRAVAAAMVVAVAAALGALRGWGLEGDIAVIAAVHVPFLAWAALGLAVAARGDWQREMHALAARSLEVLAVGGIFLGSGGIFVGLTAGLLAVFDINVPERVVTSVVAFVIGAIPVLAVASCYDPRCSPSNQPPTSLGRILRLVTWVLLPAALVVLAAYVFWLIPLYFGRAFEDRAVLLVYNLTIVAVVVFLAAAAAPQTAIPGAGAVRWLRRGLVALTGLTLLLNVYALAAVAYRTLHFGLTPNRYGVFGWNVATALMLGIVLGQIAFSPEHECLARVRQALGRSLVVPAIWSGWLLLSVAWVGA